MINSKKFLIPFSIVLVLSAIAIVFYMIWPAFCTDNNSDAETTNTLTQQEGPTFNADSAYLFCKQQCDFGPRTMNSDAHKIGRAHV